jgi:hypothetical protein
MTTGGPTLGRRRRRPLAAAGAVAAVCVTVPVIVLASDGSHGARTTSNSATEASAAAASTDAPVGARAHIVGSLVQADALGNTVIGGSDRSQLSFRFRATWTGSVAAVRVYVIKNVNGRSGYSEGNGGSMRVSLQADGGRGRHIPSGRSLASATFRPADHGFWPLVGFNKPARIQAGRLYHVVFTNVDPDPSRNFVSINALYSGSRHGRAPAVPDGLAVLEGDEGGGGATVWHPRRSSPHEYYLPILDVVGSRGGEHDGLGYMEVWDPKPIGGDTGVRQLFRTGGKTTRINGAWLRVQRDDSGGVPLELSIERPGGEALATATVAPGAVATGDPGWVYARFSKPASVPPNTDLALTASASSSRAYEAFPIRKGNEFGFSRGLIYSKGYAQFNDGSGWVGWDQWGGHDRRTSDLQFALDVAG